MTQITDAMLIRAAVAILRTDRPLSREFRQQVAEMLGAMSEIVEQAMHANNLHRELFSVAKTKEHREVISVKKSFHIARMFLACDALTETKDG